VYKPENAKFQIMEVRKNDYLIDRIYDYRFYKGPYFILTFEEMKFYLKNNLLEKIDITIGLDGTVVTKYQNA